MNLGATLKAGHTEPCTPQKPPASRVFSHEAECLEKRQLLLRSEAGMEEMEKMEKMAERVSLERHGFGRTLRGKNHWFGLCCFE